MYYLLPIRYYGKGSFSLRGAADKSRSTSLDESLTQLSRVASVGHLQPKPTLKYRIRALVVTATSEALVAQRLARGFAVSKVPSSNLGQGFLFCIYLELLRHSLLVSCDDFHGRHSWWFGVWGV